MEPINAKDIVQLDAFGVTDQELYDILADYNQAVKDCKPWHDYIDRQRQWYNFDHDAAGKRGARKPQEERYADPTPTNNVDLAVGIIRKGGLEWRARGWEPNPGEDEDTSKVEKFLTGVIDINNEREEEDTLYEVIFDFCRDGCGILYAPWDKQLADELMTVMPIPTPEGDAMPMTVYREPPIRNQVIDPKEIVMTKGGPRKWRAIYRTQDMTMLELWEQFGKIPAGHEDRMNSPRLMKDVRGKLIDYWGWKYKQVPMTGPDGQNLMNDLLGKPEMTMKWVVERALIWNTEYVWPLQDTVYPGLPYKIQFFKPVDEDKPENWGHGIIRPMETSIIALEKMTDRTQRMITVLASLPMFSKTIQGRNITIDKGLVDIVPLGIDEDIAFPQWRGQPPDVEMQRNFYRTRAQQAGFSEAAYAAGSSEISGYALSQLSDQNQIRLEQPIVHLQLLFTRWAKHVLELARIFATGAVIRISGTLKGKDFADQIITAEIADYLVKAEMRVKMPGEEVRKHAMATQASMWLSPDTIMQDYLDIDQPDDERKRQLRAMAQQDPMVMRYAQIMMLTEMAQQGDQAAAMALQMMQQESQGGTPTEETRGRPKEGRRPEQMRNVQGPTGEPTPQEQGRKPPGQNFEDIMRRLMGMAPKMRS